MRRHRLIAMVGAGAVAAFGLAACGDDTKDAGLPQGGERVKLDPKDFTLEIDNPWFPLRPGSRYVYRETDTTGSEMKIVLTVTRKTKKIANGITARVVRDEVTEKGKPVETTDDWYAQDKDGNVWYFGEAVRFYTKTGKLSSRKGSFEAGVDGAQAGVLMPADPKPSLGYYRQEYYKDKAEANAAVVSVGQEQVDVPAGFFQKVLMTRDVVGTEPKVQELKFYARGVGTVLSIHTDGDGGRAELVSYKLGK